MTVPGSTTPPATHQAATGGSGTGRCPFDPVGAEHHPDLPAARPGHRDQPHQDHWRPGAQPRHGASDLDAEQQRVLVAERGHVHHHPGMRPDVVAVSLWKPARVQGEAGGSARPRTQTDRLALVVSATQYLDSVVVYRPRPPDGNTYRIAWTGRNNGWEDDEVDVGPLALGQETCITLCCGVAEDLPEFRVRDRVRGRGRYVDAARSAPATASHTWGGPCQLLPAIRRRRKTRHC